MSLKDDNLRFVVLHTLADAVKKELGKIRTGHTDVLVDRYKEEGTVSYKVTLPDVPGVVATVTLRVPQPALEYHDDDALLKWAADNHPDIVELEHVEGVPEQFIPAQPAYDRPVIAQKKLAALEKHFEKGDDGSVIDTTTGMIVAGARYTKPPDPNQFEVRYEGSGRTAVADAYQAGKLNDVIAGSSLGAITAGPVVERRLVLVDHGVPTEDPFGDIPDIDARITAGDDPLGAEYSDGYQLPGEEAGEEAGEFDPGDWDATPSTTGSTGNDPGW